MQASRVLRMQPARALQLQSTGAMMMRRTPAFMMRQTPQLFLQKSQPLKASQQPTEDHRAHTVSQRIRSLKKIPVELMPLAFVLIVAVVFAVYSLFRQLVVDKTLRLYRQGPKPSAGH